MAPVIAPEGQRQPTDTQLQAAQRILSYGHKRTYAYGAQGATVRALQIYLASQGYPVGKFDGVWGRKTQRAFENFEKDKGQSFGQKASPKALRFISAEIAPPIPQQNPRDVPPAPPQPPQLDGGAMPAAQIPSVSPTSVPNSPPPAPPPAPRMPFDDVAQPQPGDPNFSTDLHAQIMKGFSVPWDGQAPADRALMDQGNQDRAFQAQVQTAADRSMGNSPLAGPTPSYRMPDMPPQAPSSLRDALLNPQAFMPQTPGDGMDKLREALLRKLVPVDMAGR